MPSGLQSTDDQSEFNDVGFQLVGKTLFKQMDQPGYFKEEKAGLSITAIERQERPKAAKLKELPQY